jgi:hypothetical protein
MVVQKKEEEGLHGGGADATLDQVIWLCLYIACQLHLQATTTMNNEQQKLGLCCTAVLLLLHLLPAS